MTLSYLYTEKSPLERAQLLEKTDLFASAHAEAAQGGQSAAPSADEDSDMHFSCFVKAPTAEERTTQTPVGQYRLIELDGRRGGPIDRGECTDLLRVGNMPTCRALRVDADCANKCYSGCGEIHQRKHRLQG